MGYNPFRWYTSGKYRTKPLKSNAPLLLKIRNGDFEYSPFFLESKDNDKLYDDMYQQFMESSHIKDELNKQTEAHQHAKMKRIKAQKLMEKGVEEENSRLMELKRRLKDEFGKCDPNTETISPPCVEHPFRGQRAERLPLKLAQISGE